MNKFKQFVYSKRFIAGIIALFQTWMFFFLTTKLYTVGSTAYVLLMIFSVLIMLYVFEKDNMNPSYKIIWILVMAVFPVSGALFYFLWGDTKLTRKQQKQIQQQEDRMRRRMRPNPAVVEKLNRIDRGLGKQAFFLERNGHAPAYENTSVKYYDMGAAMFRDMLADLRNAKESIFMQYFIIDEGFMWDSILKILKEKAAAGVDVRLIYDGWGCLINLPEGYENTLRSRGIKTCIFNDVKFSLHLGDYLMLNHRDHRKITVIDSTVAYSGGINIADEYINVIERFGVWKDTGFRIEGDAVWSMTTTFLNTWEYVSKTKDDYEKFRPRYSMESDGIIQPYYDTPLDKVNLCENSYLNVINAAKNYVYIATPYLIIDNELITALTVAAQSGVDVRIVVPGIPDKWYVYYVTQSYYRVLLKAGVKIYEYTPGFIHAKMYASDDMQAIVGGANTDYRSMYLNYENCCSFYGGTMVRQVKKDFEDTFSKSRQVTINDVNKTNFFKRLLQLFLRVWSPMM